MGAKFAKSAPQIQPGATVPSVMMHDGFKPRGGKDVQMDDLCKGKKVIIMGLPGAFTPC